MLLITQAMQVFLSAKRSYCLQQGLARLQEKARVVATIMHDSVLQAESVSAVATNELVIRKPQQSLKLLHRHGQLVLQANRNRVEPLVAGVVMMHFEFGIVNSSSHQIEFHSAKHIKQWQSVRWVRCELILKADGVLLEQPQQLKYRQSVWRAPDNHLYAKWIVILRLDNYSSLPTVTSIQGLG